MRQEKYRCPALKDPEVDARRSADLAREMRRAECAAALASHSPFHLRVTPEILRLNPALADLAERIWEGSPPWVETGETADRLERDYAEADALRRHR